MRKKNDPVTSVLSSKTVKYVIFAIIIGILLFLNIRLFIMRRPTVNQLDAQNEVEENVNKMSDQEIDERNRNATVEEAYKLSQSERIRRYLGEYIGFLKNGDYDSAYAKLNEDYKKNYFPDVNTFKDYIQKYYPKHISISYESERVQGEICVVEINFSDAEDKSFKEFTQRYVVKENGAYDYTISFQK